MRRFIILSMLFSVACLFVSSPIVMAGESSLSGIFEIDLDKAVNMAVNASEELKVKGYEVQKTQAIYQQVRSEIFPHIRAQSTWRRHISYPSRDGVFDYELNSGVEASQLLWSFGKVGQAVEAAKKTIDSSVFYKQASQHDVIYAAQLSYYRSLLARNILMITEKSYTHALENRELLDALFPGGRSPTHEMIRIDAEVAARIPAVNEARTQLEASLESLKRLIGVDPDDIITLQGDFSHDYSEICYGDLVEAFYEQQPLLKGFRKAIASAEAAVKSQQADFFPTISAFASWNYLGGSDKHFFTADRALDDHYTFIGLRVHVPLWEGGQRQAKVHQAKAEKEMVMVQKEQARKDLLLELKKAFLDYQQYKENFQANIRAVRLAQEAFTQTQTMFASGQATISALNETETLLTNQRINKELTLFKINISLARIEQLIALRDYE